MSSFEVKVQRIQIENHPDADALDIGRIDGQDYQFIVRKGDFSSGSLFAYIPEQAVVPQDLIAAMGLQGKLHGSNKDRVKAIRLRGVLSQGLAYRPDPLPEHWVEGLDVAEELGIAKYEIPIPQHLAGRVKPAPSFPQAPGGTLWQGYTDLENIKKYPDVFEPGEIVYVTEKLHGTCLCVLSAFGERYVSSLGLARRGLMLEDDGKTVYWETAKRLDLHAKLEAIMASQGVDQGMLFGEIVGVQDLKYGQRAGETSFAAFDLLLPGFGFAPYRDFYPACVGWKIPAVPLLWRGGFDPAKIAELTAGDSTLEGAKHIREGVVIRPATERTDPKLGRVILKSISADYLTRRGGSEFH